MLLSGIMVNRICADWWDFGTVRLTTRISFILSRSFTGTTTIMSRWRQWLMANPSKQDWIAFTLCFFHWMGVQHAHESTYPPQRKSRPASDSTCTCVGWYGVMIAVLTSGCGAAFHRPPSFVPAM